jgi:cytochrome c biogenesis factor
MLTDIMKLTAVCFQLSVAHAPEQGKKYSSYKAVSVILIFQVVVTGLLTLRYYCYTSIHAFRNLSDAEYYVEQPPIM